MKILDILSIISLKMTEHPGREPDFASFSPDPVRLDNLSRQCRAWPIGSLKGCAKDLLIVWSSW